MFIIHPEKFTARRFVKLKMDYLKYTPSIYERRKPNDYWEVWEGLPGVDFKMTKDASRKEAWQYFDNCEYIWVPTNALTAYRRDPRIIFLARVEMQKALKRVIWLFPRSEQLENEVIREAESLNRR